MNNIDLKKTKTKLAIYFALIIFFVSFILEFSYFSFKYINYSNIEKKEFNITTSQFSNQFFNDPILFNLFLSEWLRFKPMRNWMDKVNQDWFRFLNFIILNRNWDIIAQNLNQKMDIKLNLDKLNYNKIFNIWNWIIIKKIDISLFPGDFKEIIFIKKLNYSFEYYIQDVFFFFLITLLFSTGFFYIWIFFVDKNLKPVEESLKDMNDFIHNANHELKTPISVISSNLQLLKNLKNYEEDLVENSINEIKRIDNLILELSNFSDIKSLSETIVLNLKKEIDEILKEYKKQIDGKNLFLDFNISKNIQIKANKQYFYIMFSNLLRNAIKYNKEKWEIKIILDKNKLIISNTWDIIKKEDLPNIFDRFFKGEKSRNSEWFGIWLSLVKKICDIYNWKIKVSSDEKNTIFEIKF